jgi:glycyl-tRNA synthetase beta chain
MPEFFLELFSEEIPARMQQRGAADLARLVGEALAPLAPRETGSFFGPRRIALALEVQAGVAESRSSERGPRLGAPEAALAGFLRKHGAGKEALREEGDFWVLDKIVAGVDAAGLIAAVLPGVLRRFPWPKSMRWGGTSAFTWVRPLRRIVCLLDGAVVPFDLRDGVDDGHGLASADLTEGHRFMSPGVFSVSSCADWQERLRARQVIVDAAERRALVADGVRDLAAERGLTVVDDPGLVDEVAGLVEWPMPLIGRIDSTYMDLPAEVMQVSMRVNQRYFALRDDAGQAAPHFGFVANIAAGDGGAAIVAGNERVLRARFADARYFWELDRSKRLESRLDALESVTFQAKLGTQRSRVSRLESLAERLATMVGADSGLARRAARLAKLDLTTGMVSEFPELQGVMGRYYALHDGESCRVADAIRDHYAPRGPTDFVPTEPVSVSVALADKIDILAGFFLIGERPTGSADPFALRRAALGMIRIIRENHIRLSLNTIFADAVQRNRESARNLKRDAIITKQAELDEIRGYEDGTRSGSYDRNLPPRQTLIDLVEFLAERLRVQLRAEGARHDVLSAVLAREVDDDSMLRVDDDLVRLLARTDAVAALLGTEDGKNLLAAAKRAANILRIEEKKDGPHDGAVDSSLLVDAAEIALAAALDAVEPAVDAAITAEDFVGAMGRLATLRAPLDAFFAEVTVNDARPEYRRNRLALLARLRKAMSMAADFSRIEG